MWTRDGMPAASTGRQRQWDVMGTGADAQAPSPGSVWSTAQQDRTYSPPPEGSVSVLRATPGASPARGGSAGNASRDRPSSGRDTQPPGGFRPSDLRVLIDFSPTAISGFTKELLDRKAIKPTRMQGCPVREAFYLMVGPDIHDLIMAFQYGRRSALDNRIAKHDLLGIHDHLLRRRAGSSKWELVLTTGSIIPIHDAIRGEVGPSDDYRKMGYIVLNRRERVLTEICRESSSCYRPEPGTAPPGWDAACLARLRSAEVSLEEHVAHLTARDWLGCTTRLRLVTEPGRPAAPRADAAPTSLSLGPRTS